MIKILILYILLYIQPITKHLTLSGREGHWVAHSVTDFQIAISQKNLLEIGFATV